MRNPATEGLFGIIFTLLIGALVACIYFAPALNARSRKHHNLSAIFWLNFLLGWTVIGWVGAMVWSYTKPPPAPIPAPTSSPSPPGVLGVAASGYCRQCGKAYVGAAQFCQHCGASL